MNAAPEEPAAESRPPGVAVASGGLSWTRVRLPRILSTVAKAFFLTGAGGALAIAHPELEFLATCTILSALAWPLFIVSYILSLTQTSFAGSVEASADGLVIATRTKRRVFPHAAIAGAMVVNRPVFDHFVPTVEIELTNGDRLTARIPDPRKAREVVRALGFRLGGKRVHASLALPTRRLLNPLVGFASYAVGITTTMMIGSVFGGSSSFEYGFALYPVATLALYYVARRFLLAAPAVVVGDDGVVVKRGRASKLIAHRDIAYAAALPGTGLVIEDRAGVRTRVHGFGLDSARRTAVARLIDEPTNPGISATDRFAHYERGGRDVAAWRDHLARSMNEERYRHVAATIEEAAAVLGSAEATTEQRIGAALALRVAGEPPERIRIAVEGAADDGIRAALEAVAEGEDDVVIEKALKRLPR